MLMIVFIIGIIGMVTVPRQTPKEKQITFLKENEQEISDYIKKQKFYLINEQDREHLIVNDVSFDYDDIKTYQRDAGGFKMDVYTINLRGTYNQDQEFELLINVDSLTNPTKILGYERY